MSRLFPENRSSRKGDFKKGETAINTTHVFRKLSLCVLALLVLSVVPSAAASDVPPQSGPIPWDDRPTVLPDWAGQCRMLWLQFVDGTEHLAAFKFK